MILHHPVFDGPASVGRPFRTFVRVPRGTLCKCDAELCLIKSYGSTSRPDDLDNILRILLQLPAYQIEVVPLSSGTPHGLQRRYVLQYAWSKSV